MTVASRIVTPPYAEPRHVTDVSDCYFYHTLDLPGVPSVHGEWDLRGRERRYLGGFSFSGKRVLDVGTASGALAFHAERDGAREVVAYDLSETDAWDTVPFARADVARFAAERRDLARRLANGFWYAHRLLGSRVRRAHGNAAAIPAEIGPVDVSVVGALLVHVKDPFAVLRSAAALTTETMIVTERMLVRYAPSHLLDYFGRGSMTFLPDWKRREPLDAWWAIPSTLVRRFLGVLGFEHTTVRWHLQRYSGNWRPCYTVIGQRTA